MLSLLFLLLLTQGNLSTSEQLPQNLFILAGQSNMAGRGGVANNTKNGIPSWDGIVPVQCQPNPSILRLSASLTWVLAHEPLHADIDYNKTTGVGPGMPFANAVLTRVPNFGSIGLVPCAVGGTAIREWAKGGFLYDQLVRRTQFALQSGGVIRAMLWYQGESDTKIREDADAYKGRLSRFFIDLRADLGYPTLPIIQVALASGEGPYVEIVRNAQLGINLPDVQCVDAMGLPLEPDRVHLTTPAQVALASGEGKFIEIVRRSQLAINLPNVKCIDAKGLALQTDNLHLTTMSQVQLGFKLAGAFIDSFGQCHD